MSAGVAAAVRAATGRRPVAVRSVAGGDLNDAWRVDLGDGTRWFAKTPPARHGDGPAGYAAEARGLRWLAAAGALAVPEPVAVRDREDGPDASPVLVLPWIAPGRAGPGTAEALGRGLARLHRSGADTHGGPDGEVRFGPLVLPNAPAVDWPTFYAERRILPLVRAALDAGTIDPAAAELADRLAARVAGLAGPPEPPARLHGDLWSGNVHVDEAGTPWLVDPAAHGGHREVDLAMLSLFGDPGSAFRAAYAEEHPLADGAAERVALWQLAPLLVHAALFGGAYGDRALGVLRRYAG